MVGQYASVGCLDTERRHVCARVRVCDNLGCSRVGLVPLGQATPERNDASFQQGLLVPTLAREIHISQKKQYKYACGVITCRALVVCMQKVADYVFEI